MMNPAVMTTTPIAIAMKTSARRKRANGVARLHGSACDPWGRRGHAPEFVPAGRCPSGRNHPAGAMEGIARRD
jgi:hypothetical protein